MGARRLMRRFTWNRQCSPRKRSKPSYCATDRSTVRVHRSFREAGSSKASGKDRFPSWEEALVTGHSFTSTTQQRQLLMRFMGLRPGSTTSLTTNLLQFRNGFHISPRFWEQKLPDMYPNGLPVWRLENT